MSHKVDRDVIKQVERFFEAVIPSGRTFETYGARFYAATDGRTFQQTKNDMGEWVMYETTFLSQLHRGSAPQ